MIVGAQGRLQPGSKDQVSVTKHINQTTELGCLPQTDSMFHYNNGT